jgi:aquaporin Z
MKQYTAEFIGTFWLVLGGCGSAVLAAAFPEVGIGLLGVNYARVSIRRRTCDSSRCEL